MLECDVLNDPNMPPIPLPTPTRSWFRNGVRVYTATLEDTPDANEFLMNNTILTLGVLDPQVFTLATDGSVTFQTAVTNITSPQLIPDIANVEEAEQELFDLLLGTWTCEASNNLETVRIMYTIRACGELISQR